MLRDIFQRLTWYREKQTSSLASEPSGTYGAIDRNDPRLFLCTDLDTYAVSEEKIKLCFSYFKERMSAKYLCLPCLALLATCLAPLVSAEFDFFLIFGSEAWKSIFAGLASISAFFLVRSVIWTMWKGYPTEKAFVRFFTDKATILNSQLLNRLYPAQTSYQEVDLSTRAVFPSTDEDNAP